VEARNSRPPAFQVIFIVCGVWLIGLGLYFMFLRPALLPEDLRYMGTNTLEIQSAVPGLTHWLHRVFTVMGGFMMGAGVLIVTAMMNASHLRKKLAMPCLALAGVLTVGTMSLVNFQLDSDFKWPLLIPSLLWLAGLVSFQRHS
jgi:hypothetical protein